MVNLIIVLVLAGALAASITYIVKEKKRGVKCIGCSACGSCSSEQDAAGACDLGFRDIDEMANEIKCKCCLDTKKQIRKKTE